MARSIGIGARLGTVPAVDQEEIRSYIRLLNRWRKTVARQYLLFGRMEKPFSVRCSMREEPILYGGMHRYECVPTTCFSYRGMCAQMLVNYMPTEQVVEIETGELQLFCRTSLEGEASALHPENGVLKLTLPPRSVAMLEWQN